MAIKRLTIELDDSPDKSGPTSIPESVRSAASTEFKARQITEIPTRKESEETQSPENGKATPRAVGRTASDLFVEFVSEPRAIATLLMFIPFPFFVKKIDALEDLIYPTAVGVLLNIVWFCVPLLARFFRRQNT